MTHIIQKNNGGVYTVVITDGYNDLTTHPSIVEHPDLFDIVDAELPTEYQYINYIEKEKPTDVALWKIRAVLASMGLEQTILDAINNLPEPPRIGALYIYNYGTSIERQSQTVGFIQQILGFTDTQVDEIFINANNINL